MHVLRGTSGLVVLLLVALGLRLGLVLATHEYVPEFDARDYDFHAAYLEQVGTYPPSALAAPDSPAAFRPPAYPYALAAAYQVTGKRWTAGRLLGVALGVATVALVFAIGSSLWGPSAALAAGWLAAVFPPLVLMSGTLLAENLFVPLVLGAVLAGLRAGRAASLRSCLGWAALAGVACGLAGLTRTNGLLLVLPLAVAAWLAARRRPRPAALVAPAVVLVAAAAVVTPWTVRNASAFGELVPVSTQSGYTLAGTYNPVARASPITAGPLPQDLPEFRGLFHRPGLDEAEVDDRLTDSAVEFALDHPGFVAKVTWVDARRWVGLAGDRAFTDAWYAEQDLRGVRRPLAFVAVGVIGAIALLALLLPEARARLRLAPAWLWAVPALLVLSTLPILGNPRYRWPIDPFIVLVAGLAVATALGRAHRPPERENRPVAGRFS